MGYYHHLLKVGLYLFHQSTLNIGSLRMKEVRSRLRVCRQIKKDILCTQRRDLSQDLVLFTFQCQEGTGGQEIPILKNFPTLWVLYSL